jgi:hypothetical protein
LTILEVGAVDPVVAIRVTVEVVVDRSNIFAIVNSPGQRLERVDDGKGGGVRIATVDEEDKGGREGDEMTSDKVEENASATSESS